MADTPRRLILANGEQYIESGSKTGSGRKKIRLERMMKHEIGLFPISSRRLI